MRNDTILNEFEITIAEGILVNRNIIICINISTVAHYISSLGADWRNKKMFFFYHGIAPALMVAKLIEIGYQLIQQSPTFQIRVILTLLPVP